MNLPRVIIGMIVPCILAVLLFGCSIVQSQQSSGKGTENPVILKVWGGVPKEAGPQAVADLWNSKHPDVQVEYIRYSNDDNGNLRLDTALLNGNDVDLYVNYFASNYKQRVKMGLAENLSNMDLFDMEEKMGHEAEEWKIDGSYYAVPTKKNIYFVLLNKNALEENGLSVPQDWTWDVVRDYAKQLTTKERWGFVQYDFVLPYSMDGSIGMNGYVNENGMSNFGHEVVAIQLQSLHDMMYIDHSTPLLSEQLRTKMPIDMLFLNGEAAMLFGGEWVLRYVNNQKGNDNANFEIAFAPIPKISKDQEDFKYIGGLGDAISINPRSKYKKEALDFIKWYVDEGVYEMAAGGRLPASKDTNMEKALSLLTGKHNRFDSVSLERIFQGELPTVQLPLEQEVIDLRKDEFEQYFSGVQTLEETIHQLVDGHNRILRNK